MIKHMNIEPCDKYDEKKGKFWIVINNGEKGYYSDNIWKEIYKHWPDTLTLETLNFAEYDKTNAVGIFACYINSFVAEGWEVKSDFDYSEFKETGEKYVYGMSIKFKISKENKEKLVKNIAIQTAQ